MDFCRAEPAAFPSRGIISIFCEETVSGRRTFVFCQISETGRRQADTGKAMMMIAMVMTIMVARLAFDKFHD